MLNILRIIVIIVIDRINKRVTNEGENKLNLFNCRKVYKNKCHSAKILLTIKQSNAIDC